MARAAPPLLLSADQRRLLVAWQYARETPRKVRQRAEIILRAAAGASNRAIAREMKTTLVTVLLWRGRFQEGGLQALTEVAPGRGPKPTVTPRQVRQIVEATRRAPPKGKKRWSVRSMAKAQGVSPGTVQRIWDEYGLRPHLGKRTREPRAAGRVRDVVGLYLNPPDQVLALCLDRVPRQRPNNKRVEFQHAAPLLEALGALEGVVVGDSRLRPRQQAFLGFLRRVERAVPSGTPIHLVVDREGTHRQGYAQSWLKRRRYFHLHPAPAGSTWLSGAAAWLKELSRKRTQPQTGTLERAIADYRAGHQPQPFSWTAPAEKAR